MNDGIIAVLVIFGLMALASFVSFIDRKKPKIQGVQPRVEVYKKKKGATKKISA